MDENSLPEGLHRTPENSPIKIGIAGLASSDHPNGTEDGSFILTDKQSPLKFFGIFDGVGGHAGGQRASTIAQRTITSRIENGSVDPNLGLEQTKGLVKSTILEAHEAVKQNAVGEYYGMATTASMGAIWEGKNGERKLVAGNVGDSRIYVRRGKELIQLTQDDNLANEGRPNVITQAVGDRTIEPRITTFDLLPGDQVITVSDGISDALGDDLTEVFNQALSRGLSPDKAAEEITNRAREFSNSGRKMDDQTTIVVDIKDTTAPHNDSFYIEASQVKDRKTQNSERLWTPGTMVNVKRSDGTIEDGWFVGETGKNGDITLRKEDPNGQILKKLVTTDQLGSLNPDIKDVSSWDELTFAINQLPDSVQGSTKAFTKDQLIYLAEHIKNGTMELSEMTRSHGLRDKIEELVRLDMARNQIKAA